MIPRKMSLMGLRRAEDVRYRMVLAGLLATRRVLRAMAWLNENGPENWEQLLRGRKTAHLIAPAAFATSYAASIALGLKATTLKEFLAERGLSFEWARSHGMFLSPDDLVTEPVLVDVWHGFLRNTLNPEELVLRHLA